jgi:uncharacterized protein (TIGR00297 family)
VITRTIVGLITAAAIAIAAYRAGALSRSGAIAALLLGTLAIAAGWEWGALLILFFLTSSALSRVGAAERRERTGDVLSKEGPRDALQVLANGGVFGLAAVGALIVPWIGWMAIGAGAIAAATADTWATEVGTLSRGEPRLITSWEPVPPGISGGITPSGLAGAALGATFIALVALICGWSAQVGAAAALGGMGGALADSWLGAGLQQRRRCPACNTLTERHVHRCGRKTDRIGGVAWLDNDMVNVMATAAGGAIAAAWLLTR